MQNKSIMFQFSVAAYKGFTLIELLVVIAIIGILAAVGIPSYQGYVEDGRDKQAQNNLQSIAMQQKSFYAENFRYFTNATEGSDQSAAINSGLFESTSGPLPTTGSFYNYWIANTSGKEAAQANSFDAVAQVKADPEKTFTINQDMVKTKVGSDGVAAEGW